MDPLGGQDDIVAAFQIEERPVRGRIARLGAVADRILSAHAYPPSVADLLGQALTLAVLVGSSLKFDGRLIIQAQGDGPAPLLVTDYTTATPEAPGRVRGFVRVDQDRVSALPHDADDARALLGDGQLAMTIDQGPDFDRYQSLAPIEGAGLAQIAEAYFEQSEQVPTRIMLSAQRADGGGGEGGGASVGAWRAGGAILQKIAGDDARGDPEEAWREARALFDTLDPQELVDRDLSTAAVLFRLFHENGVRVFPPTTVSSDCRCSAAKVQGVLARFPRSELADLVEEDGRVAVRCEYCNALYRFTLDEVAAGPAAAER